MRRLPIANPCHEDWNAMQPEGSQRFCGVCSKSVHDLSSMTPQQAQTLVETGRRLCVRFLHDGEQVVHLAPAPADRSRLVPMAAGLVAGLLASCTPHGQPAVDGYDWGEDPVTVDHRAAVLPDAPVAIGDEPCAAEIEESPEPERIIRKTMGKPAIPVKGRMRVEEVVGDGL